MDPCPPKARTWSTFSYITYWISDAFNVATWELASSMLAIGLSWREALIAIAVGNVLIAFVITANGYIGARLHIPFPVLNRSSFGFFFSYFSVVSRCVLALFWFAVQTFTGSECVYQMIKAIWPSFARFPNRLPTSSPITSSGLLCYFIYWLIQFPFLLVSPQRIRWLFLAKSIIVPIAWLAMMIWAFVTTSGHSGKDAIFSSPSTLHGSSLAWAWLSSLNSVLGNFATLACNIPDFTRYARTPKDQYIQLAIIPFSFMLAAFMGIAVTSAGTVHYGQVLWDPLRLIDHWDNRAAAFFAAFAFALATLGTNISANSLSAGNDFAALWPKYLNIRRGQVICAIIGGWALCPWEILANAIGFLTFMAGYTVFLGPIAGIMISDYYFVHRGALDVPDLYRPHGRYRYTGGINWRAGVALLVAVPPNLPGLVSAINPKINVGGGIYLFNIAYILGFTLAATVYWLLSVWKPAQETMLDRAVFSDRDDVTDDNEIIIADEFTLEQGSTKEKSV
ncbi:cytosine-purine permease [Auricularia subglabra TFB-10046 SS5]|nr:cytosine-purine permease [Auricularia subglabra TFB-10046 SS5]